MITIDTYGITFIYIYIGIYIKTSFKMKLKKGQLIFHQIFLGCKLQRQHITFLDAYIKGN